MLLSDSVDICKLVSYELKALPHGIEWIPRAGVLLNDVPLGAGFFGGLDDGGPVQVAVADFHDGCVIVVGADAVVLEVQQGEEPLY